MCTIHYAEFACKDQALYRVTYCKYFIKWMEKKSPTFCTRRDPTVDSPKSFPCEHCINLGKDWRSSLGAPHAPRVVVGIHGQDVIEEYESANGAIKKLASRQSFLSYLDPPILSESSGSASHDAGRDSNAPNQRTSVDVSAASSARPATTIEELTPVEQFIIQQIDQVLGETAYRIAKSELARRCNAKFSRLGLTVASMGGLIENSAPVLAKWNELEENTWPSWKPSNYQS